MVAHSRGGSATAWPEEDEVARAERAALVAELFKRHHVTLLSFVEKWARNREDAEDIAQEAYLRLLGASALEADRNRARSYLFTTALNLARDGHRRRSVRRALGHIVQDACDAEAPSPDLAVDRERTFLRVEAVLREILPRPRLALALHVNRGMTYGEIAAELDVSKKTVERDIGLALEICRSRIEGCLLQ